MSGACKDRATNKHETTAETLQGVYEDEILNHPNASFIPLL